MIPSFSRSVDPSSSSRTTQVPRTFLPFGKYADVGIQKIKRSHPDVRLHVGSASTLYLSKGTLMGKDITYVSQVWNAWDADCTQMFYEQVLPYIDPETLRPLMGICAPTVIGIHSSAAGRFTLAMEPPHPTGWRSADPYISAELKEKIVIAYQSIHGRNILHNDVKLENVLIGNDDNVTIVDFCKMVVNPEPADLVLEMRAVKFMLDYDGAKEVEYERLRRAESRTGKNYRRSWLRRAAENLGFGSEVDNDEQPSQDEIDFLPFTRKSLMKWDSEVVTEGTTHCPGWRGERFEVPDDMQSPPWPGMNRHAPLGIPPHQPIDTAGLVKTAFGPNPFSSYDRWMKRCHYFPYLLSPVVVSIETPLKKPIGTCSSSTSSIDFSDYATGSEHNPVTGSEASEGRRPVTPSFIPKRLRTGDPTCLHDHSFGNERTRSSKSLESFVKYQDDQTSWVTRRIERPSPLLRQERKRKELPPLVAPSWGPPPSEPDLSTPASSPRKSSAGSTMSTTSSSRSRMSALTDPGPTRQTLAAALPRRSCSRQKPEGRCSIVVMDSDGEDKVWFISKEALRDVKGYLEMKKAMGAAIEMPSGWIEGDVQHSHLRVERALRPSSTRLTRKRVGLSEEIDEEAQTPKRRRSWPEIDPYRSNSDRGSLLCDS